MNKGEITRRLNLLAGMRPPLPGHYHWREANLRLELAECFEPRTAIEMLWVADIAYCTAAIEMYRVQTAGFRLRIMKEAQRDHANPSEYENDAYSTKDRNYLAGLSAKNFSTPRGSQVMECGTFATLLGHTTHLDLGTLRLLQQLLHDETKERDRLVNLFDRRRRQAMRDVIEWDEAMQRAAAAGANAALGDDNASLPDGPPDDAAAYLADLRDMAEADRDETA